MIDLLGHDSEQATRDEAEALIKAAYAVERPVGGFRMVLADPPWLIEMRSVKGEEKSPQAKYKCLPYHVLRALPVNRLAAVDAMMGLWGTAPMLPLQIALMREWGFQYTSIVPWFKGSPNSSDDPFDPDWKPAFGPGYVFRNCSEFLLIGKRGEPVLLDARRKLRGAFFGPQREHSRKPDEQYTHAEALSPGPYLELFSRTDRPGWVHFGDQAGKWRSE